MKRVEDTKRKIIRSTSQQMEKEQLTTTTKAKQKALKETILLVSIVGRMGTHCISVRKGRMLNAISATNSGMKELFARVNCSSKTQTPRLLMNMKRNNSLWHRVCNQCFN